MTFYYIIEMEFSAITSSPHFPITGTDAFWDGSVPNPMIGSLNNPTSSLSSIRPEASAAGAGHSLHSQDLGPVPVVPGGGVIPTLSIVTSTVSRSVNSSGSLNPVPGQSMGINLPSTRPPIISSGSLSSTGFPTAYNWNRPPWMFQYPVVGNPWQPSAALGAPNQAVSGGLCPTSQDPLDSVRELFSEFKDSMKAEFSSLNSRLSVLESSTKVRVDPVPPSPESQEDEVDREDDEISVAPGSQERVFLDEEESDHPTDSQTVKRVPSSGATNSHQTVGDGSPVPETDSTSLSKENLRSRVYTLMRDVAKVPFASPPKPKRLSSNFEASCGLIRESSSTYNSFPESNHVLTALQIINDSISNDSVDKQSSGSKFSSFGPTSFSGVYNVKDYQIFNSTLGRLVPTCDKAMSNLLGSKPVDGLRLSQATWSKSENLLRNSSQVLASAEHYLSATGAILQDLEGEGIAEIKSLLLQLDKALGTSQVLVSGALANLTLSKRSEILDKSSVNETLKDSLMKSPLTDKIFGLSLQKVQEEVSKAPQSVSVNVRLNDGKRTIASSSSGYQPTPTFSAKRRKVVRRKQYANSSKTPHAQKSGSKGAQKSGPRP